ncbi:MAG: DUF1015 family protein [Actinomycetaceae bacterium]|nr:DUF1015 family protein [Actinomycetaceae bacterium]
MLPTPAPVSPTTFLVPRGVDLFRWCVVAADQFSSSPEYWSRVDDLVADAPSSLRMIVPEVFLGTESEQQLAERVAATHSAMSSYLANVLVPHSNSVVYVERRTSRVERRRSLVVALDLEQYSYRPGDEVDVRASEETVLERIPAREAVRSNASLELPHVQVLFDDPSDRAFGPIERAAHSGALDQLYETDLMLDGGSVKGWKLEGSSPLWEAASQALDRLDVADRGFRFIVGDGNHSLAAARSHWARLKQSGASDNHPARFALVELIEVHDPGLVMEPIHRWLRGISFDQLKAAFNAWNAEHPDMSREKVTLVTPNEAVEFSVAQPGTLIIEAVQHVVDGLLDELALDPAHACEYIHGEDEIQRLVSADGGIGILLPSIDRSALFDYVAERGTMPRKSFSLGEAEEKRYYLECRAITD